MLTAESILNAKGGLVKPAGGGDLRGGLPQARPRRSRPYGVPDTLTGTLLLPSVPLPS